MTYGRWGAFPGRATVHPRPVNNDDIKTAYALSTVTVQIATHRYGGLVDGGPGITYVACARCKKLLDADSWFSECAEARR